MFRCLCDDGAVKMCVVGGECGPGVCVVIVIADSIHAFPIRTHSRTHQQ